MMWITNLELRNIKSYAESGVIRFAQGVNAIGGPNGAGKSTLLEAIGFALFDSLPYTQSQFLREGEKSGEVVVSFVDVLDEREYQVVRTVGSSSIYVFDPQIESKLVTGKTDVVDWLKEHLGVDQSADLTALFEDSIGVPQGLLTAAFLERPAGRKSKFDPLLQVDEYEQTWTRLRDVGRIMSGEIESLRQQIAELTGELKQLPALNQERSALSEELETQQADRLEIQNQLGQLEHEQASLDEIQGKLQQALRQVELLDTRLQVLSNQQTQAQSELSESQAASEKIDVVRQAYQAYMQAEEALRKLEGQRAERDQTLKSRGELDKQVALTQQRLSALHTSLEELQTIREQMEQLQPLVRSQEQLETSLASTERKIAELDAQAPLLKNEEDKLAALENRLVETREAVARRNSLADQRRSAAETRQTLDLNIAKHEAALASASADLDKITQHQSTLEETDDANCPVCQQPLDEAHREQLVGDYAGQSRRLQDQIQTTVKQIEIERAAREENQAELSRLDEELDKLPDERQLTRLETDYEALKTNLQEKQDLLKELPALHDKREEILKTLQSLEDPKTEWSLLNAQFASRTELEKEQHTLAGRLDEQKAELAAQEARLETLKTLDEQLATYQRQRQENEAGYRTYLENRALADRLEARRERLESVNAELELLQKEIGQEKQALNRTQESYDEARHIQVRAEVIQKSRELARLETLIEASQKRGEQLERDISNLLKRQEQLEAFEADLERNLASAEALEFIRATIRNAGPHVTRALVQTISIEANRVFSEIMNDHTLRLMWNEDYSITLEQAGEGRDFSQLSGGEKMAAALSVRLALLRELSQIRVAFFDEPTSNLDDQRRENLASQITRITGFNQLFVISHDDTFERETYHVLRVNKSQGASTVEVG